MDEKDKMNVMVIPPEVSTKILKEYSKKKADWKWAIGITNEGLIPFFEIKNLDLPEKESYEYEISVISIDFHHIINIKIKEFNKEFNIIICPLIESYRDLIKAIASTTRVSKYNEREAKIGIIINGKPHIFEFNATSIVYSFLLSS